MLAVLVAACGDDETTTTVTETVTAETTSPGVADGAPPPADREVSELTSFTAADGNVGCAIEPLGVRCDIDEREWEPPAAPKRCKADYGQGIELVTGSTADFVCAADSVLGSGEALAEGESIAAGLLRCESSAAGIRCEDTETGRGFAISRSDFEIF